jgi:hypothetical protein
MGVCGAFSLLSYKFTLSASAILSTLCHSSSITTNGKQTVTVGIIFFLKRLSTSEKLSGNFEGKTCIPESLI